MPAYHRRRVRRKRPAPRGWREEEFGSLARLMVRVDQLTAVTTAPRYRARPRGRRFVGPGAAPRSELPVAYRDTEVRAGLRARGLAHAAQGLTALQRRRFLLGAERGLRGPDLRRYARRRLPLATRTTQLIGVVRAFGVMYEDDPPQWVTLIPLTPLHQIDEIGLHRRLRTEFSGARPQRFSLGWTRG